jgi:proteasome beta subunit
VFKGQSYGGSSFYELLKADGPDLLPDFSGLDFSKLEIPHGTTVLALLWEQGALIAGDRLATEGMAVGTRDIEKVYKIDETCVMAIAGAAGPAIEMVRLFQLELEHYQKLDRQDLTFEGKANRLSFLLRQNLPAAMQGLVVIPLFAGFDHSKSRGRIYKFDITGGRYSEHDYYATGSGGKDARASLKKTFAPEGLGREKALDAAVEALMDAADEDRATGGFDLRRAIYPTCMLITEKGHEEVSGKELLASHDRVVARWRAS